MSDAWSPKSQRIEERYAAEIRSLADHLSSMLRSLGAELDPSRASEVLRDYLWDETFADFARAAASRMVTSLWHSSSSTWRAEMRRATRGREMHEALRRELEGPIGVRVRELVEENARLIRNFPEEMAQQVTSMMQREWARGRRYEDVLEEVQKRFPELSRNRATLIARTETSKASTALTQARSERLGVGWYVWRTSKDQRVRPSHRKMDRVLVSWADPPSPEELAGIRSTLGRYHAGNAPNCRCYPEPLLRMDQVTWPVRVYAGGGIQRMTRAQFERTKGREAA